ncbi:MAG: hypothetical protein ACI4TS_06525 [Bacteroidaceae bacterium]
MERKSPINELYSLTKEDKIEIYKKFCKRFGNDNPFASFSIGLGFYLWKDNRYDWIKMTDASDFEIQEVRNALEKKKQEVFEIIDEKSAEVLCTVPDDSFIYYYPDNNNIKILFTAWAFKKPGRTVVDPVKIEFTTKDEYKISFIYDEEKIPNYNFLIVFSNKEKRNVHTNKEGDLIACLKEGEKYSLFAEEKEFDLIVDKNQKEYSFDVTQYGKIRISATLDGSPLANELVDVSYKSKKYTASTNEQGYAEINVPLHLNEEVTAYMRNETAEGVMSPNGAEINFSFATPKAIIHVEVKKNGNPCENQPVTINYAGNTYHVVTDGHGCCEMETAIASTQKCEVSVEGATSLAKILAEGVNEFVFNIESPLDLYYVRIKDHAENNVANYPIKITNHEQTLDFTSDENGIVLPEMTNGDTITITDGKDASNISIRDIEKNQSEYVFHISEDNTKQISVKFLNIAGNPVTPGDITIKQQGKQDLHSITDNTGTIYFKEGMFDVGKAMNIELREKHNDKETITTIPFKLDKDEYEYVIQEKETTYSLWKILLSILAIILILFLLYCWWFPLNEICHVLYHSLF